MQPQHQLPIAPRRRAPARFAVVSAAATLLIASVTSPARAQQQASARAARVAAPPPEGVTRVPAPPSDTPAPPPPRFRVPGVEAARGPELPSVGCVVGGSLIALGLGTAIATGVLLAEDDRPSAADCVDGRCTFTEDEALLAAHVAGWGVVLTGIVLGTTIVLAGTASDDRTLPSATVAIVPRGFPGGGGLGMNGRF